MNNVEIFPVKKKGFKKYMWCAPITVCSITRRSPEEIHEAFTFYKGTDHRDMSWVILGTVLETCGYKVRYEWGVNFWDVMKRDTINLPHIMMWCEKNKDMRGHVFPYHRNHVGWYTRNWQFKIWKIDPEKHFYYPKNQMMANLELT